MSQVRAVDLFAGAGGWTTGATQAGVKVVAAINHWQTSVDSHSANHPDTKHMCQDIALLDPRDLPDYDMLLASSACQGHTRARGKERPHHDTQRSTAWHIVDVLEATRPKCFAAENVIEMRTTWALYPEWIQAVRKLGYAVAEQDLCASGFGVPQERLRLIVTGVLDGKKSPTIISPKFAPVPIRGVIDFAAGNWSPVKSHVSATVARTERGRKEFGHMFVMPYYGSGSGLTGRSLDRPIGTITTIDRWAVVRGDEMRMLSVDEYREAMGFPRGYILHGTKRDQVKQLGNAVSPCVARSVVEQLCAA